MTGEEKKAVLLFPSWLWGACFALRSACSCSFTCRGTSTGCAQSPGHKLLEPLLSFYLREAICVQESAMSVSLRDVWVLPGNGDGRGRVAQVSLPPPCTPCRTFRQESSAERKVRKQTQPQTHASRKARTRAVVLHAFCTIFDPG